jgi:NADH:ubiquinone oxidoreductase subunit 2 (subunit N)
MLDAPLTWAIIAPLTGGVVAALLLVLQNRKFVRPRFVLWLRLAAFVFVVAGLVAEVVLLLTAEGSVTLDALGVSLAISTPARLVLVAANIALVCAVITAWMGEDDAYSPNPEWGLLLATLTSSLLAGAALVNERIVAALFLLGAALSAAALALARPRSAIRRTGDEENLRAQRLLAMRMAGGLKLIGLATLATGLMSAGAVLVATYTFNLENRALLQLGLALLAIGIIVRAGSMPFAAASADTIQAAPSAALMILGAGTPVALMVGLLMLSHIEGSLARGAAAGWLGAAGTLLAGLRALGVVLEVRERPGENELATETASRTATESNLIAMTVAAATGWAIFGILSGSQTGAIGAIMIAVNMALALPILLMGRRWTVVGVASLLGLPPFGGFGGAMLVAESAANAGGLWLALLLLGSALVGAGWLGVAARSRHTGGPDPGWREWLTSPAYLITTLLVILQLILFLASSQLISQLTQWATIPWLTAP